MMQKPVAVVVGAGRGIGRAAAVELARRGYRLSLVSRNKDELTESARLAGGEGLVIEADVTRPEDAERVIRQSVAAHGRVDAIVNCAGLAPVRSILEMTVEEWRAVIDTNLSSAFYLCRAAWPVFERQKEGVMVNISSLSSRDPFPGFAAYGAAKAGLNLFGLSAAREGEALGIRVHTIAPGAVETGMFRALVPESQWPREKTLDPADVAKVIAQCVAGDLRYTSGEVIFLHRTL